MKIHKTLSLAFVMVLTLLSAPLGLPGPMVVSGANQIPRAALRPTGTLQVRQDTTNWPSYTDPVYGYILRYPPDWHIRPTPSEGQGGLAVISPFSDDSPYFNQATPMSYSKVEIGVWPYRYSSDTDLLDWFEAQLLPYAVTTKIEPVSLQNADGFVLERTLTTDNKVLIAIAEKSGAVYVAALYGDVEQNGDYLRAILSSMELPTSAHVALPDLNSVELPVSAHTALSESNVPLSTSLPDGIPNSGPAVVYFSLSEMAKFILPFGANPDNGDGPRTIVQTGDGSTNKSHGCPHPIYRWFNCAALDISMPSGTQIYAAHAGNISDVGWDPDGFGKYIIIAHDGSSTYSLYAHLRQNDVAVSVGSHVEQGRYLGLSGDTGNTDGPHLHFGISLRALSEPGGYYLYLPVRLYYPGDGGSYFPGITWDNPTNPDDDCDIPGDTHCGDALGVPEFFPDRNFGGEPQAIGFTTWSLVGQPMNDNIESVKVPKGYFVRLHRDTAYHSPPWGPYTYLTESLPNLDGKTVVGNQTSAVVVDKLGGIWSIFIGVGDSLPIFNPRLQIDFDFINNLQPGTMTVTWHGGSPDPVEDLLFADWYYDIVATIPNGTFLTDVTFHYDDDDLIRAGIIEDHLTAFFDAGDGWTEAVVTARDPQVNTITVETDHFSRWVLGSPASLRPELAYVDNGVLVLNMGSEGRRKARHVQMDEINEGFVVRQLSTELPGEFSVIAFGFTRVYSGVASILADGDDGNDVISLEAGEYAFTAPAELHGGSGDDQIHSGDGADTLSGSSGNDEISGGGGADTIVGDDGDDKLSGGGGSDTITGDSGSDHIEGGEGGDDLSGGGGNDTINGDSGDDHIQGGDDNDDLHGGSGNDTINGDSGDDRIEGDDGDDFLYGDETLPCDTEGAALNVSGINTAQNRAGPYFLYLGLVLNNASPNQSPAAGSGGSDEINGGSGNDRIFGGGQADTLSGNDGDDEICGNSGNDTMHGDDGNDSMHGGSSDDQMEGNDGADTMHGDAGNDEMYGNAGDDVMYGGDGDDHMEGSDGADVMHGDAGSDDMQGQANADEMYGDGDRDKMYGNAGNDLMHGGSGDDYMEGNPDDDSMYGDDGQDDMIGGTSTAGISDGQDILYGGADHDVMVGDNASITRPLNGSQWIRDTFSASAVDVVRRTVVLFDIATTNSTPASDAYGDDKMYGEGGHDIMYGQGGNDAMWGGPNEDYIEGNAGGDTMRGDAGQDDMLGGTGRINDDPPQGVNGRLDGDDQMYGESDASDGQTDGDGADVILGDNGTITRPLEGNSMWQVRPADGAFVRVVTLLDVETLTNSVNAAAHGNDTIYGNDNDDTLYGQGGEDRMHGGAGDDYMEGNAASDVMYGDAGDDDMLGGTGPTTSNDPSTALPGRVDASTLTRTVPLGADPAATVPLGDVMYGGDGSDVMLGDNGIITRPVDENGLLIALNYALFEETNGSSAPRHTTNGTNARIDRNVLFVDLAPSQTAGSDLIYGGPGDDDLYGQFDDTGEPPQHAIGDELLGEEGEDAMVGDLGIVSSWVITGETQTIRPPEPFIDDDIFVHDTLFRQVTLWQAEIGGNDRMLGGPGGDWMHGGAGDDLMNGNSGNDRLFGDNGVDVMWGGPHHDHLWGGYDDDYLDVKPRPAMTIGNGKQGKGNPGTIPADPLEWFLYGEGDNFQHLDYIYGGWDQDAMQADVADTGPVPGDRLIDWVGAYNVYYLCPPLYGEYVITRDHSPHMVIFLQDLAAGDGAVDTAVSDSSGFNEIAIVFSTEIQRNSHPPHPDNPGHFTCSQAP